MCIVCDEHRDNEKVINEIKGLRGPEYWTIQIIEYLYIAGRGINGPEARLLALQALNKYILWHPKGKSKHTTIALPKIDLVTSNFEEMYNASIPDTKQGWEDLKTQFMCKPSSTISKPSSTISKTVDQENNPLLVKKSHRNCIIV